MCDADNALEKFDFILIFLEIQALGQSLVRIAYAYLKATIKQRGKKLKLGGIN